MLQITSDEALKDEWNYHDELTTLRCDLRPVHSEADLERLTLESQIKTMLKELIVNQDIEEITSYMVSQYPRD